MQANAHLLVIIAPLVLLVGGAIGITVAARRFGYKLGGDVVVRCREGHLFTTIWIPLMSLKAVRLGWIRWQYCPVGEHWTLVTPVRDEDLTDRERWIAEHYHDVRLP
jgi:hypothetical protein